MEKYADMPLYIWERRPDGTETEEYRERKDNPKDEAKDSASFTMNYPNSYLV